jgi:signal transduction histidine kinase
MNSANEIQNNEDLAFFGRVNASISHELKNILAIISETTGLLDDLTEMAVRGKKVEPDTLRACCKDIIEEIQRGFGTIKQMNAFSHSVDTPFKSVNLIEVLDLMINLAGFLSFAGKVRFDPSAEVALMIVTCPFRLQNIIYQALVFAFEWVGPAGEILVALHPKENGEIRISFSGLGSKSAQTFPDAKTKQIAESIGVALCMADDYHTVDIYVPESVKNG